MSKATELAHRWKMKISEKEDALRAVAASVESAAGSFAGGYVHGRYPSVAGVPTTAAIALVGITAGIALEQPDVTAFSMGIGNSYLAIKGYELGQAAASAASAAPAAPYVVNS